MNVENKSMEFWYRDERVSLPHATNHAGIKTLAQSRVVPGLNSLSTRHPYAVERGVGFVPYLYETDRWTPNSDPGKAILEVFRQMGYRTAETSKNDRRQPILPDRGCLVSVMRGSQGVYPLSFFTSTSFVIGPLAVYETDGWRTPTFLVTDGSIIVDGPALLGGNTSLEFIPSPEEPTRVEHSLTGSNQYGLL